MSEFVPNFVVPIISSKNEKLTLNYKYKKITYHESSIKLKLQPGEYDLVVMNSIQEYSSQEKEIKNFLAEQFYPKCLEFQIRVKIYKLMNKRLKNWECNNVFFDILPQHFNNMRDIGTKSNIRDFFSYYSNNVLVPKAEKTIPIKTNNPGLLRLNIENDLHYELKVTLRKNVKVFRTARSFKKELFSSRDKIIVYYLKANSEYELHFSHIAKVTSSIYNDHCHGFKLQIEYVGKPTLDNLARESCKETIPKSEDVMVERMIGVKNSYWKYGTKNILHLFTYRNIVDKDSNDDKSPEKIHPKSIY